MKDKKMMGGKKSNDLGSLERPANRTATLNGTNRPIRQHAHVNVPFGPMGGTKLK